MAPARHKIIDLRMPRCDGVEATRRLTAEQPEVRVAVPHINNLFSKTGVRDRAQAVRYAFGHGLAQAQP
jgi:DNA-binding NarL/FixJ family response regulator